MSHAFVRMKMRATTRSIDVGRKFIDFVNRGILRVYTPVGRWAHVAMNEYPVFVFVGSGVLMMLAPVVGYPVYMHYRNLDARHALERERVELCLQKGIDPFPMIRYKDYVRGNISQTLSMSEADAPPESSYEHRSVENMKRKAKLYSEVMGIETSMISLEGSDPTKSLDAMLALRERERGKYNKNRMIIWQDPVDLAFPRRPDELMPTSAASERPVSPAVERQQFMENHAKR